MLVPQCYLCAKDGSWVLEKGWQGLWWGCGDIKCIHHLLVSDSSWTNC